MFTMVGRVLYVVIIILIFDTCYAQNNKQHLNLSTPFDSISLRIHQEAINTGASYLLLVPSPQSDVKGKLLICTSWLEPPRGSEYNFEAVEALLNGKLASTKLSFSSFHKPILEESLALYKDISTCELVSLLFSSEGFYLNQPFYLGADIMLAVLIDRGIIIHVSDYDGYPAINRKLIDCN